MKLSRTLFGLTLVAMMILGACSSKQKTETAEGDVIVKLRRVEVAEASFDEMKLNVVVFIDNQTNVAANVASAKSLLKVAGKARDDKRDGSGIEEEDDDSDTVDIEEDDGSLLDKDADTTDIVTGAGVSGKASASSVPAFSDVEIKMPMTLKMPADSDVFDRLLTWGQIVVEVEGDVMVGQKSFPISGQREIAAPNSPKVILRAAQVASENNGELGAAFFDLGIENPNAFTVAIDDFAYAVEVAGKELRPMSGGGDSIPPSSVQGFEENVEMTVEAYGAKPLRELLSKNTVPYRVYGKMKFRGIVRDFEFTGDMKFPR